MSLETIFIMLCCIILIDVFIVIIFVQSIALIFIYARKIMFNDIQINYSLIASSNTKSLIR